VHVEQPHDDASPLHRDLPADKARLRVVVGGIDLDTAV
jgi:hypothetical protein